MNSNVRSAGINSNAVSLWITAELGLTVVNL